MPIEDVQFMLAHSVPDSALIFANSAQRDYRHYPTPSNFVIQLSEPIRNVYGIEVLDAAIANTMYNVDFNNNMLRYVGSNTVLSLDLAEARDGLLDGDLLDSAELVALNVCAFTLGHATPFVAWLADPTWASYAVAVVQASKFHARIVPAASDLGVSVSPPTDDQKYLLLIETRLRSVPMQRVTSSSAPAATPPGGSPWFAFDEAWYSVLGVGSPDNARVVDVLVHGSVAIVPIPSEDAAMAVQLGSVFASAASSSADLYDVVTYEIVQVTAEQFTAYVGASILGGAIVRSQANGMCPCRLVFAVASASIEVGTYTSFSELQTSLQEALSNTGCPVAIGATSALGIKKQGLLRFTTPSQYRLMLSSTHSPSATVLGFDSRAAEVFNTLPRRDRTYGAVKVGSLGDPMFCSVWQDDDQYRLDSPGIINLLGTRYVTLRCPEIEQHLGSTGKYGRYSTGIGVFKLAGTNEVAQVRSDYVNLVRKPFHPIGRLTRLTLRFELMDGTLYDFKGINNQLLISIKYYSAEPVAKAPETGGRQTSLLNPDYDPDFLAFLARQSAFAPRLDDNGYDPYDELDQGGGFGQGGGFEDDDDDDYDDEEADAYASQVRETDMRTFGGQTQRKVAEAERRPFRADW